MNHEGIQVTETARRVRNALSSHGEMSAIDLELMVDASPQLLDFTLGSLAHEGGVEILTEVSGTKVRLKFI